MSDVTTASALAALAELQPVAIAFIGDLAELEIPPAGQASEELQLFAAVDRLAKTLEKAGKRAKEIRDGLNDRALDALETLGLHNAPLSGGPTIYRERQLWANVPEPEEDGAERDYEGACDALEEAGLGEYVQRRFNVQSLSAYFRELEREEDARRKELEEPPVMDPDELLPEALKGRISLAEVVKAKARQS